MAKSGPGLMHASVVMVITAIHSFMVYLEMTVHRQPCFQVTSTGNNDDF